MEKDMLKGYTQTTLTLSQNTVYNLITTDNNHSFSAHLYTTNHGTNKYHYMKACNIGYAGKYMVHIIY